MLRGLHQGLAASEGRGGGHLARPGPREDGEAAEEHERIHQGELGRCAPHLARAEVVQGLEEGLQPGPSRLGGGDVQAGADSVAWAIE